MADRLDDFQKFRAELNEEILSCGHLGMKRFFALDHQAYEPGPLGTKTKELLGLVASAVLRCDDCITYHLVRCGEEGWKREEVIDALNVALIVGGSITPRVCANARNRRPPTVGLACYRGVLRKDRKCVRRRLGR
jgi:AhpD family alkylhydroperoxidase